MAQAVGGRLVGDDVEIDGVGIDSRSVGAGQLFVPIVAARDGHEFVSSAVDGGASAYLTAQGPIAGVTAPAIEVSETAAALADLGAAMRDRLPDRVVGVTGSVGKTSTKDLLAGVLATTYRTTASEKSFNNELGLPLTLANAPDDTEAVVVEMGARGIGHIDLLCGIARPTVGIITRVEGVHLELFGDIDAVAQAKGELVEALPVDGLAVLNADHQRVAAMADRTDAAVLTFGLTPSADVHAAEDGGAAQRTALDHRRRRRARAREVADAHLPVAAAALADRGGEDHVGGEPERELVEAAEVLAPDGAHPIPHVAAGDQGSLG